MFVSNPSTLAHICQSIRYNLVSVLLLSCFVKVRCLSYGLKSTLCPKSNPIHTIFTNCAPFPLHFHSISISIWISTPLKGSTEGMSQIFRLLYLGNGWADCVEIWHALGDPLVTAYAIVTGGVSLHVRTCRDTPTPRFCISETAWPIVFKFGMCVGGH